MDEITVAIQFSLPCSPANKATVETALVALKEALGPGANLKKEKVRISSLSLIKLGLSEKDMYKLTEAGIVSVEDLLAHTEDELAKMSGVGHGLTGMVRMLLHNAKPKRYLEGDSAKQYRQDVVSVLNEQTLHIYARLRRARIKTLAQLAAASGTSRRKTYVDIAVWRASIVLKDREWRRRYQR